MSISRELSKFIEPGGQLEYDNTTSGLSATTIKSAIDELNTLLGGGNVGSQATFNVYEFTATASQTTFSLSSNHGQGSDITAGNFVDGTTYIITSVGTTDFVTLYGASSNTIGVTFTANTNPGTGDGTAKVVADYIPGFIKVYLNGVLLSETDYVASDGDNVVLDVGADVGALLSVVVLDSFNTATQLRVLGIDAGAPDNSVNVDASGNLLIGRATVGTTGSGHSIRGSDSAVFVRDGGEAVIVARNTNDGELIRLDSNGVTGVGSIGTHLSGLYISDDDTGLFFNRASNNILPYRNDVGNEGPTNGTIDLGRATAAFKRMYLTDGINDSGQDGSETVFNDGSTTADFRIESNDDTHMFFVDGGLNRIGIGTDSPVTSLTLGSGTTGVSFKSSDASLNSGKIAVIKPVEVGSGNGHLVFETYEGGSGGGERMRIVASGNVGINKIDPETILQIGNPINRLIGEEHQIAHSAFDLFTNWESDTAGKGAIITFSDYYNDGAFQRTTRAGIKGVTRYAGNDASGALVFYTNENASDSLFPRMSIDETGKVGIRSGTGGYAATWLHVDGDPTVGTIGTSEVLRVGRPLTNAVSFDQYAAFKIGRHTTPSGSFESFTRLDIDLRDDSSTPNSDTNVMTLLNNGYVGIGTTSPLNKVSIEFTGASENGISLKTTTASNGSKFLSFLDSAGIEIGYVEENTSTSVNYSVSSDQRLKENIVDAPSASDDIDAIQVRSFDWKVNGSHQKYGMIAQELVTVAPNAVSQPEDPEAMMGVDYSKLVPMMLKEIQQLRARVAQLESN